MEEKLLSKGELAEWLGISIPTIDRWRRKGLPHLKAGKQVRFDKNEVLNWLKAHGKK